MYIVETGRNTSIEHSAVYLPSLVLTVTTALPAPLAVTSPDELTSATDDLLDDQETDESVAYGFTVAVNWSVAPSGRKAEP